MEFANSGKKVNLDLCSLLPAEQVDKRCPSQANKVQIKLRPRGEATGETKKQSKQFFAKTHFFSRKAPFGKATFCSMGLLPKQRVGD